MRTPEQNLNLALGYHRQGELGKAEKHYKYALQAKPNDVTAQHLLGVIHYQKGRFRKSKALISKALELSPKDPMILANLGNTCQALGEAQDAILLFDKALNRQPNNPQVLCNRGNARRLLGQNAEAIKDYRLAIQIEPRLSEALRNLGLCLQEQRRYDEALSVLEHCLRQAPQAPEAHLALANLRRDCGDLGGAISLYKSAQKLGATQASIDCEIALTLRDLGRIDAAKHHLTLSIDKNPSLGRAWRALVNLGTFDSESDLLRLRSAFKKPGDRLNKMHLEFALGKALEDQKNYTQAFTHYANANKSHQVQFTYDISNDLSVFDQIIAVFDTKTRDKFKAEANNSNQPIFIIGMPRSGTSLVEQIISAHSEVFGAGETEAFPQALFKNFNMADGQNYAPALEQLTATDLEQIASYYLNEIHKLPSKSAHYVSDKLPMNFINLGIIRVVFPNAKIIHCRRNPISTCWSIYKNYLPAEGHLYAANFSDLASYYKGYQKLMAHWHTLFPTAVIEVDYEALVSDPEIQTENLLKALGLTSEPACLAPHKNKRAVRTLSAAQVRQPIHTKSVESWRNYETELFTLIDALEKTD